MVVVVVIVVFVTVSFVNYFCLESDPNLVGSGLIGNTKQQPQLSHTLS